MRTARHSSLNTEAILTLEEQSGYCGETQSYVLDDHQGHHATL